LCSACLPLATDPLGILGQAFELGAVIRNGFKLAMPVFPQVAIVALIFAVPGGLVDLWAKGLNRPHNIGNLYDGLIGLIGDVACLALFISVAEGRKLSFGEALQEGFSAWGRVFGARFRAGLWTLLFLLLLVVPGIWKGVSLAFAGIAALRLRSDGVEVSQQLVTGRWWPVFGALMITGVICYVPAILVVMAVEFLPLPEVVGAILGDWASRIAGCVDDAFMLAMFYGLCRTTEYGLGQMYWATQRER
jgi:hypothetical protein